FVRQTEGTRDVVSGDAELDRELVPRVDHDGTSFMRPSYAPTSRLVITERRPGGVREVSIRCRGIVSASEAASRTPPAVLPRTVLRCGGAASRGVRRAIGPGDSSRERKAAPCRI